MAQILVGKAPLTTIRLRNGSRSNLAQGAIVPNSIDPSDAERLVDEGYLVYIDVVDDGSELAAAEASDAGEVRTEPTTIPEIEAVVGNDSERAQAFLDKEMASPKPRTSLVAKLEAVIEAAEAGDGAGGDGQGGGDE